MEEKYILGVSGSPRSGGNTDSLLDRMLEGAQSAGARTEAVHLRKFDFRPCVGCEKCRKDKICTQFFDGMQLLYPRILEAGGLILGSPTHNYNVTAWVKAFIDRLYCFYDFTNDRPRKWSSRLAGAGRKALVYSVCEQPDIRDMGMTIPAMEMPLNALGYEVSRAEPVLGVFDAGRVRKDLAVMDAAFNAGKKLAESL